MSNETTAANETVSSEASPTITINDIAFLIQIVEVCTQRGAFRAEEMNNVGAVYDRVKAFIVANIPPAPAPEIVDDTTKESK